MTSLELLEKVKLKLDKLGQFAPVFTPVLSLDGSQISFVAGRVVNGVLCQSIETWASESKEAGGLDDETQASGELIALSKCFPLLSERGWEAFLETAVAVTAVEAVPAPPVPVTPTKKPVPLAEIEVSLRRSMSTLNTRLGRGEATNAAFKSKLLEYGVKGKDDYVSLTKVQLEEFNKWASEVSVAAPVEGGKKPVADFDPMVRRKIVQPSADSSLESQIIIAYSDASDQLREQFDAIVVSTGFSAGSPNSDTVLASTWEQVQRALNAT